MRTEPTLDAAFSGFRLVREQPRAIAVWAAVCLAFSFAEGLFATATAGSGVMRILALAGQANPDPDAVVASLGRIAPTYLVLMSANMVFYAVFLSATNRAVSDLGDRRCGSLRVGTAELRQFGMIALLLLVTAVVYLALGVVGSLVGALVAMAGAPGLGRVLAVAIVTVGLGYVWLRLSLASPLTFASARIDVFGSWALTKGRLWAMSRIYLLTLALTAVVYCLGMTLVVSLVAAATGGVTRLMTLAAPDLSSVAAFLEPPRLILLALQAGVSALILPVVLCPAVEIHRRLAEDSRSVTGRAPWQDTPWA
jgi:hypothetical protein